MANWYLIAASTMHSNQFAEKWKPLIRSWRSVWAAQKFATIDWNQICAISYRLQTVSCFLYHMLMDKFNIFSVDYQFSCNNAGSIFKTLKWWVYNLFLSIFFFLCLHIYQTTVIDMSAV